MARVVRLSRPAAVAGVPLWRAAALAAVVTLAAGLRTWGLLSGQLLWHPDEIFMVVFPLNLLSGDLNPHVFSYPGFHFYELGAIYGAQYLLQALAGGPDLTEWVAARYLWSPETARTTARWVSVLYAVATVPVTGLLAARLTEWHGDAVSATATAWRAVTSSPGLLGAGLAAVHVLLVRQAPLAGTDTPLAFWYTVTVLAAVRLLHDPRPGAYLAAGVLVGVGAAVKYPGAAAAGGVASAHLLAGRSWLDRRVWLAGVASVAVFLLCSPYTLLDAGAFRATFAFQLRHAAQGRFDLAVSPLYQLTHALRYGPGTALWLVWLAATAWAVYRRRPCDLVVVGATLTGYAAVHWGELVFARYVLPLAPLQVALVAAAVSRVATLPVPGAARAGIWALVVAGATVPLRESLRLAALQGRPDTRTQARAWIEAHVPPGATLCNFGGWAGDVQVRTYENLWWRLRHFLRAYDDHDLAAVVRAAGDSAEPTYSYAVQSRNLDQERGAVDLVRQRRCSHVVVHDHPLAYSTVDSAQIAGFLPYPPVFATDPEVPRAAVFDPMDAYYVPLAGPPPDRPGPRIAIWSVPGQAAPTRSQTVPYVLSRALSLLADSYLQDGHTAAERYLEQALQLAPDNTHALRLRASLEVEHGRPEAARRTYQAILAVDSLDLSTVEGLARLDVEAGRYREAVVRYTRLLRRCPTDARLLDNLAVSWRALGRTDTALVLWRRALAFHPDDPGIEYNLGRALLLSGDVAAATERLDRAAVRRPDEAAYQRAAAAAWRAAGHYRRAADLWRRVVALTNAAAARAELARVLHHDLGDPAAALPHWERAQVLEPRSAEIALERAQALLDLDRGADAVVVLRAFLAATPDHPRAARLRSAIAAIQSAAARTARAAAGPGGASTSPASRSP